MVVKPGDAYQKARLLTQEAGESVAAYINRYEQLMPYMEGKIPAAMLIDGLFSGMRSALVIATVSWDRAVMTWGEVTQKLPELEWQLGGPGTKSTHKAGASLVALEDGMEDVHLGKVDPGSQTGRKRRRRESDSECYRCHKVGHFARNCSLPQPNQGKEKRA